LPWQASYDYMLLAESPVKLSREVYFP